MTSTDFRDEPSSDVLDLYGVLPRARPAARTEDDPVTTMIKGVGRNLAAIIGMFAVYLPAFIICTTLFSLGVGLAVLGVGLVILVAALVVAGWSARMTRALLGYAGTDLPVTHYPATKPGVRGMLRRLAHLQSWRDLLHVLVNFVLATFSFSVAVSWVVSGPAGLTYWFWTRWLPDDDQGLPDLLGFPGRFAAITFNTVLGVIFLVTTPMVLRGLVVLHTAVARALLVDETPALRQQVEELTVSRTAAGEAEAQTLRRLALAEIRTLSRGIATPILAEQGLPAAITALAARGSVPTSVDVEPLPLSDAAQNAAYFVVAEALANLEKHSQASQASVEVRRVGALAVVNVTDNGLGGASLAKGHGC